MNHSPRRIHLFQGYGVELEYMIVDRDSLRVRPITDTLIAQAAGGIQSDYVNGMVTWSNELVLHVVELKSTRPEQNFNTLESAFVENVRRMNALLASSNAMLMPGAAHPFMDPANETRLWPHDNNEVYEVYNRIFDCRGHGWSNLQSTHLNLPFYDDEEFARLHAAVRVVLPLLPALCASSPVLDGKPTGWMDTRLKYYKSNQVRIPSITGRVIPEAVFSKRNYLNTIYQKIKTDIARYDPDGILDPVWVNSRGAIPRFDRGSIEIRIMDIQESPAADMAILTLVIETIRALVNERFIDYESQMHCKTDLLATLLDKTTAQAQQAVIGDAEYLALFGYPGKECTAADLWRHIDDRFVRSGNAAVRGVRNELQVLLKSGTLSQRILRALGTDTSPEKIKSVYRTLCDCLAQNKMFLV